MRLVLMKVSLMALYYFSAQVLVCISANLEHGLWFDCTSVILLVVPAVSGELQRGGDFLRFISFSYVGNLLKAYPGSL